MENRSYSCGLDVALSVVGGKWKPIVLFHLNGGPRRFGELKRLVAGISEKVLIQQVRELAEDGIIVRCDYHEVPPRVDYQMTEFGRTLSQALMPLCAWGNENRHRIENWPHTGMAKCMSNSDEGIPATAGQASTSERLLKPGR